MLKMNACASDSVPLDALVLYLEDLQFVRLCQQSIIGPTWGMG